MEAAPPTNDRLPPAAASAPPPPGPASISIRWSSDQWFPTISAVWPRSAQLATAFLLGLAAALLGIHTWSMSRWSTRPLELERSKFTAYRIDLNQADHSQLVQVPGIGDRTAEKIEEFRQEHGALRDKAELTQIPGIGPAKLEKMNDWVTARPETAVVPDTSIVTMTSGRKGLASPAQSSKTKLPSKKVDALKEAIDVNQADLKELQKLPGIGPKIAQRILDERAKSPFRTVEDLRRVSGIGPKVLEKLRPYVIVGQSPRVVANETRQSGK